MPDNKTTGNQAHESVDLGVTAPILIWPIGNTPGDIRAAASIPDDAYGWLAHVPADVEVPEWAEWSRRENIGSEPYAAAPVPYQGGFLVWFARNSNCSQPMLGCGEVWSFQEAPQEMVAITGMTHGGDEDWLAILPAGWSVPSWMEAPGSFAICDLAESRDAEGRLLLVGGHA